MVCRHRVAQSVLGLNFLKLPSGSRSIDVNLTQASKQLQYVLSVQRSESYCCTSEHCLQSPAYPSAPGSMLEHLHLASVFSTSLFTHSALQQSSPHPHGPPHDCHRRSRPRRRVCLSTQGQVQCQACGYILPIGMLLTSLRLPAIRRQHSVWSLGCRCIMMTQPCCSRPRSLCAAYATAPYLKMMHAWFTTWETVKAKLSKSERTEPYPIGSCQLRVNGTTYAAGVNHVETPLGTS